MPTVMSTTLDILDIAYLETDAQAAKQASRDIAKARRKITMDHPAWWALAAAEAAGDVFERKLTTALETVYRDEPSIYHGGGS